MYAVKVKLKKSSSAALRRTLREAGFVIFAVNPMSGKIEITDDEKLFLPNDTVAYFSCLYNDTEDIPSKIDRMIWREIKKRDSIVLGYSKDYSV